MLRVCSGGVGGSSATTVTTLAKSNGQIPVFLKLDSIFSLVKLRPEVLFCH